MLGLFLKEIQGLLLFFRGHLGVEVLELVCFLRMEIVWQGYVVHVV